MTRIETLSAPPQRSAASFALWPLLLLTLLGGLLRFAWLDRPAIWGDEAMVWGRTCGTYRELLSILQSDGFVPLHYQFYWVLSRWITLTPAVLRFWPALAGTLMIPTMYMLARQLGGRRLALATALLTAFSAWMLNYSRDAKMYMPFWLMLTLHAAALLAWLRSGGRILWLAWIAAGLAAVGLHASGMLMLVVEAVFVGLYLLWPRVKRPMPRWRLGMLTLIGLALVSAGPAGYYTGFNRWIEQTGGVAPGIAGDDDGQPPPNWNQSGIQWVDLHTRNKTTPQLLLHTATAHLMSWTRAEEYSGPGRSRDPATRINIAPNVLKAAHYSAAALGILLVIGLVWPLAHARGSLNDRLPWLWVLWLALWIVLPIYGFYYCRSVKDFASPWAVLPAVRDLLGHWLWLALPLAAWAFWRCGPTLGQRLRSTAQLLAFLALIFLLCWGAYELWHTLYQRAIAKNPKTVWHSLWMPRYVGIIWPAVAVSVAAIFLRLPKPLRWTAFAFFIAVNLAQFSAKLYYSPEPPIDRIAADAAWALDKSWARTYSPSAGGGGPPGNGSFESGIGRYYMALLTGKTVKPRQAFGMPITSLFPGTRLLNLRTLGKETADAALTTLVIWERIDPQQEPNDAVAAALGPAWRAVQTDGYQSYSHWSWQRLWLYQRRVFVRTNPSPSPATRPATTSSR